MTKRMAMRVRLRYVADRMQNRVLPFVGRALAFDAPK